MVPVLVICREETARLLTARRSWLTLLAFALVWALILLYAVVPAAGWLDNPEIGSVAGAVLERVGLQNVQSFTSPELALYWLVAPWLLPVFAIALAADQTASDRARGTLRFLTLRCSRGALFTGRFLGQCALMTALVLVTLGSVLVVVLLNSPERWAQAWPLALPVAINQLLVLLPYTALMACMSVLARSARQATLYAVILWILISLGSSWLQARFGPVPVLDWVLPGSQVSTLVRLPVDEALRLAPVPVLQTAVLLGVGWLCMRRVDL